MRNTSTRNAIFYSIAFGVFLFAGPVMAQSVEKKADFASQQSDDRLPESINPAAPGTYTILAKDANSHEVFPVDILIQIEKARHKKKAVFIKAGKSSIIKILPYREINAKNFVPVPEYGVQY